MCVEESFPVVIIIAIVVGVIFVGIVGSVIAVRLSRKNRSAKAGSKNCSTVGKVASY